MHRIKENLLFEKIKENKELKAVRIKTQTAIFHKKFNGSMSYFFRCLKNGLYTINGVTNREFFRGISGIYFSLEKEALLEIIIAFDENTKALNEIQVKARIKKLLGMESTIQIGLLEDFLEQIQEMFSIQRHTQSFGDYYFKKMN